jgi:aspartyl-tRNA(Asn)/glutamyl-tRNA(Gln) amidotransferase subunit C
MRFNSDDIQHLADLARLELSDAEKTLYGDQLSSILEYADKLKQVNTFKITPPHELSGCKNSARPDLVYPSGQENAIISQAPVQRDNLIVVPPVLAGSDTYFAKLDRKKE